MWKLHFFFRNTLALLTEMFFLVACEDAVVYDSYGLDNVIVLEITSENLAVLNHGTYSKSKVPVAVTINGVARDGVIAVAGATSVDDYKKSYEIQLDEEYLEKTVVRLNAMSRDPSAMRALLSYRVFQLSGVGTPYLAPIAVWLNGEYAGLYLLQEKYDEAYFRDMSQQPVSLYQAENSVASMDSDVNFDVAFSVKMGDHEMVDLKYMLNAVIKYSCDGDQDALEKYVDVPGFLNYMAVASYIRHVDGIVNNYYLLRLDKDTRFHILPWDLDYTFFSTTDKNDVSLLQSNLLMRSLLENNECNVMAYQRRFQMVASSANAEILSAYVDELKEKIGPAYAADGALASQAYTIDEYAANLKEHFLEMEQSALFDQNTALITE